MPTFIVVRRIFYSVLLINFKNWLHLTIKSQNVVIFVSTTYSWLQSSYLRSHLEDGEIKRLRINFILHKEVVIGIIQKGSSSLCTDKFPIVNIDILHNCKNNEEIILFFGVPLWISNCHVQFHVDMTNSSSQGETRNPKYHVDMKFWIFLVPTWTDITPWNTVEFFGRSSRSTKLGCPIGKLNFEFRPIRSRISKFQLTPEICISK